MIPKIIHMIWIGPKNPPLWCIDSWRTNYINNYPDWKFMLWNEEKIDKLNMVNRNIYDIEPTLRGKSDIVRYEILYQYGGLFLDADSYWIEKDNSDLNILLEKSKDKDFFCAREPLNKQFFANGIFGCSKNNDITLGIINYLNKTYLKEKQKHKENHAIWLVTGPVPFTKVVNKNIDKATIFPTHYFLPEVYKKNNREIELNKMKELFPESFMYQYWLSHTKEYEE